MLKIKVIMKTANDAMEEILDQKIAIIVTSHIIRKVLQCEA